MERTQTKRSDEGRKKGELKLKRRSWVVKEQNLAKKGNEHELGRRVEVNLLGLQNGGIPIHKERLLKTGNSR